MAPATIVAGLVPSGGADNNPAVPPLHPFLILALGVVTVVGLLVGLRAHAFLALISAALVVSLLAPADGADKVARVAEAFGRTAGGIGVAIALAAVIGRSMATSGAADRIVRSILALLGERRAPEALALSGYVLGIPVFFDTVFYLLVPLARSLSRRVGGRHLLYVLAISVGAATTHTLVPPTPGPLLVAERLGVSIGAMMGIGAMVALPAAAAGLVFARLVERRMPIAIRLDESEGRVSDDRELPALVPALLPIALPVLLISAETVTKALAAAHGAASRWRDLGEWTRVTGNPNVALLMSAVVALLVMQRQARLSRRQVAEAVEDALESGGVIILITAAGGAFGAMLQAAGIGAALQKSAAIDASSAGVTLALGGFALASLLKIAQGSSTVAMIGASAVLGALQPNGRMLGFHPAYLGTAIGCGSLVGSWMNDSGFWIYSRMGGFTEAETLATWTPGLAVVGLAGMATTLLLSAILPLV